MATYASNTPISAPILHPDKQVANFYGFTFSHELGIHPAYVEDGPDWQDLLAP